MTQTITAVSLRPGTYVRDNLTEWARADAITKDEGGVIILWTLSDGSTEECGYEPEAQFTIIDPEQTSIELTHAPLAGRDIPTCKCGRTFKSWRAQGIHEAQSK